MLGGGHHLVHTQDQDKVRALSSYPYDGGTSWRVRAKNTTSPILIETVEMTAYAVCADVGP